MKNKIKHLRVPYAMTVHDKKEINAVVNTLKTSTQMGKKTKEFENKISNLDRSLKISNTFTSY